MLIGSVVAVFGVIMMSMTTPIMVSNFHSLYINAFVGQPTTLKKFNNDLGTPMSKRRRLIRSQPTSRLSFSSLAGSHSYYCKVVVESLSY